MTRRKQLGELGEKWTPRLLERAGFRDVEDLNKLRNNHPGGDFLATRNEVRYFVGVKARNKYETGSTRLNAGYKIAPDKVRKYAKERSAIPAWLTIQIDTRRQRFFAYFGTIKSLPNKVASAPMTPNAVRGYECLAEDKFNASIVPELSNQDGNSRRRSMPFSLAARKQRVARRGSKPLDLR